MDVQTIDKSDINQPPVLTAKVLRFMAAYSTVGRVDKACKIAGMSRETHYQKLRKEEAYRAAFAEADQRFRDVIEAELVRRAIDCESDTLLMFIARGAMPDKYRDRASVDVSGTVNLAEKLNSARHRLIAVKPDAA